MTKRGKLHALREWFFCSVVSTSLVVGMGIVEKNSEFAKIALYPATIFFLAGLICHLWIKLAERRYRKKLDIDV